MDELKTPNLSGNAAREAEQERLRTIEALRASSAVNRLMKTRGIPEQELTDHAYTFKRWIEAIRPCSGCRSLEDCRQKTTGYHAGLVYDGLLMETVEACPYQLKKEESLRHLERFLINDLGEEFSQAEFAGIDPANEPKSYNLALKEAVELCEMGKGAYLYGNMGTGKTYLAACCANRMAKEGKTVAFVHYPSYCDRLARTYFSGEYQKEAERCRYADLLVIDDIGAEEVTERNRMVLISILDQRMKNHRMTWFTGNGDFAMLQNHLKFAGHGQDTAAADRIIERIRVLAKPVEVNGADRRHLAD